MTNALRDDYQVVPVVRPCARCGRAVSEHRHYSGAATYPSMCVRCERKCQCGLIAKVRADEREQAGQRVESLRGAKGVTLSVAAAVASGNSDTAVGW